MVFPSCPVIDDVFGCLYLCAPWLISVPLLMTVWKANNNEQAYAAVLLCSVEPARCLLDQHVVTVGCLSTGSNVHMALLLTVFSAAGHCTRSRPQCEGRHRGRPARRPADWLLWQGQWYLRLLCNWQTKPSSGPGEPTITT